MLIRHEREKLIQAIIYFAQNTKFCGKVKLFKLLYFLDFEHYKTSGRSVTGLIYSAWKMGPVPTALTEELDCPEPDLAEAVEISDIPTYRGSRMLSLKPTKEFSPEFFTKREMKLLERLSSEYFDTKSEDMTEATHLENMPWDRVYNQEKSPRAEIPYEYALLSGERQEMLNIIREREELIGAIG